VYEEKTKALLGTAHVAAGELIPGRLLSPIEIEQIANASRTQACANTPDVQPI
jgi:tRNA pseudouridine55 synthase